MDNQDKTTFSLDDEEIIEEEVTERDEEYDDGYDDEEYDDEGYDDEEYDEDYEDDYDDGYDDGYNDDYYDDRLNKVLDEIAELKRGMAPAPIQQQPIIQPPQYIYQPSAPPAGSEVVMYNEISRLRDELAKNTSSLEMQKELTRIKEDMARDQKIAEAEHKAELQRLQSKIDDLLKNGSGPQGELLGSQEPQARIEGASSTLDVDKLLSINEAVLRATRDSDARIQGEIGSLKKQLEDIPSLKELNSAVSAVKKAASSVDGISQETITKLSADIAALKASLDEKGFTPVVVPEITSIKGESIDSSELLRQLYDIKNVIGSASEQMTARTKALSELANEYKKVNAEVHAQTVLYKDKLASVFNYAKKLSDSDIPDAVDLLRVTASLADELSSQTLNRSLFSELAAFCVERGIVAVTPAVRDSADRFFHIVDKLSSVSVDKYGDYLPDLVAAVNTLENNSKQQNNANIVESITKIILSGDNATADDKQKAKDLMDRLINVTVADLNVLPKIEISTTYNIEDSDARVESVFSKLEEIKTAVLNFVTQSTTEQASAPESAPVSEPEPAPVAEKATESKEEAVTENNVVNTVNTLDSEAYAQIGNVLSAVEELKAQFAATTDSQDMSAALEELRNSYIDITSKLVDISEKIQEPITVDAPIMSDDDKQQTLDDLAYIRSKLDEYDELFSQIGELRTDIIGLSGSAAISEADGDRIGGLMSEITSQFDKLYEDLSNALIESETNIIGRMGEGLSAETVENAKNDILAETQSIKDTLLNVSDMVCALPIVDTLDSVKAEILADTQVIKDIVSAQSLNDTGAVYDAIEQLRNDIAYLRDQADIALSDNTQASSNAESSRDNDKLIEYIDDIAARVTALSDQVALINDNVQPISDSVVGMSDNVASVSSNVAAIYDGVLTVTDGLAGITDSIAVVSGNVTTVNDNMVAISNNVATVNDNMIAVSNNVATVNDNMIAVNDSIAGISDSMASVTSNVTAVYDSMLTVTDSMAGISDSMTSVSEGISLVNENLTSANDSVTALGDNIAAINDNISAITDTVRPLADDVSSARDAASATLDALAPIAEQLNAILDRLDGVGEEEDIAESETAEAIVDNNDLTEIKDGLNTLLDTLPLFPQADDLIAARDNTYSILDTLALMPQADDVAYTRDTVAAILNAVNTISEGLENIRGGLETSATDVDLTALTEATAADVAYIRQKLDESDEKQSDADTLAAIVSDIEQVLGKIEEYETLSANNKQEIIDTVAGIREEIHISTLDENMSAAGLDDGTRDALVGEISEIRERLGAIESSAQSISDVNTATLDALADQIAALQATVDEALAMTATPADTETDNTVGSDLQSVIDELAALREKLESQNEYDTVEEILSLREDVKAARIVDQDEVSGELEAIKNELAAISSGNILDEIRALREDIINLPVGESSSEATDGEINLVLNEIVSLRDEVFAFKDEVIGVVAADNEPRDVDDRQSSNVEDINTILDELTALHADQTALNENVYELKDIISRRTTIGVAEGDEQDSAPAAGLDVVLDEIINLKNDITRIEEVIGEDRLAAVSEQVEEIRALLEDKGVAASTVTENAEVYEDRQSVAVDLTPIMEQFDNINAALDELRHNREEQVLGEEDISGGSMTLTERFDELHNELDDIKLAIDDIADSAVSRTETVDDVEALRAEIEALRAENEQLRLESNDELKAELAELKETIRDMSLMASAPTESGDNTSYAALIEEIKGLRDEVAASRSAAQTATLDEETLQAIREALYAQQPDVNSGLADELGEIRDEIAQLRSLTTISAESSGVSEVAAIRDEINELKSMLASSDSLVGVAEDLSAIRSDVLTLKEEPDLGVMSEILALRDEFQSLREQIEDVKRIAGKTDSEKDESLMNEVQSLRDQLFAISMANINDPDSGESNYESYNNIILDELGSLRDQVSAVSSASDLEAITEQFNDLRTMLENKAEAIDELSARIDRLDSSDSASVILDELNSIREDMANQRDADMTSLNFMSEMARLLERQNQYLTENAGNNISTELESLKAELASSDAVAEEVAKLREVMTQSGSASDNETILAELADLREELSHEKPSQENALILDAIARLRDEITVLAEREKARDIASDADLSDSLSDLKEQLNEIAGIVEPVATENNPQREQSATSTATAKAPAKRGKKPSTNGKSNAKKKPAGTSAKKSTSTGNKRGRKPSSAAKSTENSVVADDVVTEQIFTPVRPYEPDFESIIDEQASKLGGEGEYALNPTMTTVDAMDMADKLAKQVANKLIMEQLVEQLGDGGVSEERVDEILRDILPQEFTTIAETETSDKVRRLANRLVLDKLRSRLNGKKSDDDEE